MGTANDGTDPVCTGERAAPPTVHVVCFEEAGDCTLERVAREAAVGDHIVVLGPEGFARRLIACGLAPGVTVESRGRAGALGFRLGIQGLRSEPLVQSGRAVAYGPRAFDACANGTAAATPSELPPVAGCPEGRRLRLRRELGLAPAEIGVLIGGEPSSWIDLSFSIRALSMALVAGAPVRPIVSPHTPRIAKLGDYFAVAARGGPLIIDPRADRPWELLPALDAAVFDSDGARTQPVECAGWRRADTREGIAPEPMSPLPALWSIAFGLPTFVHEGIDLGAHGGDSRVVRFGDDIAALARALHARASSPSAASR